MTLLKLTQRFSLRLIRSWFEENNKQPLKPGDAWVLRMRYTADNVPVNLDNYLIVARWRHRKTGVLLERRSDIEISSGRNEIGIDNQASVITDGGGNVTGGTGVFELRADTLPAEVTAFTPHVGLNDFEVMLEPVGQGEFTLVEGEFEVLSNLGNRPL